MFFNKTERKKSNMGLILTVGALAAVGVLSITQKGKALMNTVLAKAKDRWNKSSDLMDGGGNCAM